MADFRTHSITGLITGYAAAIGVTNLQIVAQPLTPLYMFTAAFIGSFLPDLDSDHGTSFKIVFSVSAICGGGMSFLYFLQQHTISLFSWVLVPPLITLIIRYGIGALFKKCTVHRGIFHSLPAIGIASLSALLLLRSFALSSLDALLISGSIGLGYLSHLILDELYAVNFDGLRFSPKKSLGTALSLGSSSKLVTVSTYVLLTALFALNCDMLATILL
ncbi:hypothetical protein CSB45_09915 [candidate division KSB3 bacterium]|uniref:Metal-dependent hydrolase n=1 Tax=candidate division KSB3 bacterium TaxID=2044937 RepID=A0A2G6E4N8_9BACT|nr:MAG: hypothetical protein CSB45_09915 [candidate division KSB3 bacterium]